jgi:hypothetical protein
MLVDRRVSDHHETVLYTRSQASRITTRPSLRKVSSVSTLFIIIILGRQCGCRVFISLKSHMRFGSQFTLTCGLRFLVNLYGRLEEWCN